jgi:site-specific recombinase XerD
MADIAFEQESLAELTPDNAAIWQHDQEQRGNSPHSIAGRIYALKVFSNKFVFKTLELTTVDLLRKVERPSPKLTEPETLDGDEHQLLLDGYDRDTFEDVRDRAFLTLLAATGLRLSAVGTGSPIARPTRAPIPGRSSSLRAPFRRSGQAQN